MIKLFAFAYTTVVTLTLAVSQAHAVTTTPPTPHKHGSSAKQTNLDKKANDKKAKPTTTLKTAPGDIVIYVGDLHCKHCAKRISSKLYAVKGVVKVRTDLKADVAIVTPQKKKMLDPLALWSAAKKSGFPAFKLVAPAGTYIANAKTKEAQLVVVKTVKPPAAKKTATKTKTKPKTAAAPKVIATKEKS